MTEKGASPKRSHRKRRRKRTRAGQRVDTADDAEEFRPNAEEVPGFDTQLRSRLNELVSEEKIEKFEVMDRDWEALGTILGRYVGFQAYLAGFLTRADIQALAEVAEASSVLQEAIEHVDRRNAVWVLEAAISPAKLSELVATLKSLDITGFNEAPVAEWSKLAASSLQRELDTWWTNATGLPTTSQDDSDASYYQFIALVLPLVPGNLGQSRRPIKRRRSESLEAIMRRLGVNLARRGHLPSKK